MKRLTLAAATVAVVAVGTESCNLKSLLDDNIQQFNEDSNRYKSELDQTDSDINNALSDMPGFGKTAGSEEAFAVFSSPLCGVTIDSSELANNVVTFNFDGTTPCFTPSLTRSGSIRVELISGTSWAQAGAVIKQTFTDFKIVRMSDNASIMFNGIKTLENIQGHDWIQFLLGNNSFSYRERALNMDVTFDNNESAVWNSARVTTWSYHPAGTVTGIPYAHISFEATGDTTINGSGTTDSWGTNRFGQEFVTYYNSDIVSNSYCGLWRFNSGELVHEVNGDSYMLTLGVNTDGSLSTGTCAYGFKVSWDVNGNSNSAIFSY